MKNRSINPYETDKSKDEWSPLSMWNNLPGYQMLRMFGGVTLGGDGENILDKSKRLDIDKISVGDMVYFGNSHGLVTSVILYSSLDGAVLPGGVTLDTGKKLVPTSIVGITVKRYLNYLSPAERLDPTTKGYDVTGDGVTMTYLFYQGLKLSSKYKSGGGALFLYPGSYYVVRKRKDVGSYPDVYNSIQDYQSKYETESESDE